MGTALAQRGPVVDAQEKVIGCCARIGQGQVHVWR